MKEIIMTGKSVEEATEAGCAELGLSREQVTVEIIDMPVKKFFKSTLAKVKVTSVLAEPAADPRLEPAPAKPQVQQAEKPAKKEAAEAPAKQPQQPAAPKAAKAKTLSEQPEVEIDIETNEPVKRAAAYLSSIFAAAGAGELALTAASQGDAVLIRVNGAGIQNVIDTKGEVVQALSYLTDRAINKGVDKKDENYIRVRLDVAGYRNRREDELLALAQKTAKEVLATKRSRTLAPMNPYERLIVHTAISEIDGLTSESIGADTERRVVVKSTAPDATQGDDWRPQRKESSGRRNAGPNSRDRDNNRGRGGRERDNRPRGGGDGRGNRSGGQGRPYGGQKTATPEREYANRAADPGAEPVVPERREAVKDGDGLPLYGKIEL